MNVVEPKVRTGAKLLASADRVLRMWVRNALGTLSLLVGYFCMVLNYVLGDDGSGSGHVLDIIFIDSLNQDIALAVHEKQRCHC